MKILKCKTGEVANGYGEYLTTMHWKILRMEVWRKSDGKCFACKKDLSLGFVAHHVSSGAYRRIGHERIDVEMPRLLQKLCGRKHYRDDVVAVCRKCHTYGTESHLQLHQDIHVPWWVEST